MDQKPQAREVADREARRVVGVAYEPGRGVPRVILKAVGATAEDVIWQSQRSSSPPLVKDPRLLESLYRLPLDANIPAELFELVAILLVHIASVDAGMRKNDTQPNWGNR